MKKRNIVILVIILIIAIIISAYVITKKVEIENRKYEVETISEYKYFVLKENNTYGVIDTKGNKIVEPKYENVKIPNPQKAVFICYENENTKVLNENGEEILTQYENIEPLRLKNVSSDLMYEKTTLRYSKDNKYGIISIDGKKITNAIYDEIETLQFKEGELLVKKDTKYGVINIRGTILVKVNYDAIETDKFYEEGNGYKNAGYIVSNTTEQGYRYGYVNVEGKEIIETKYNELNRVIEITEDNTYIICAENGKYGLFRNNKQIINNEYQSLIYNESNNTITALKGKKYGVLSIDGKIIIPLEYKQIDITGQYIYSTTTDGNVKVFDSNGKETTDITENTQILDIGNLDYKIYIETIDGKTRYNLYKNKQKLTKNEYSYIEYLYDNYFIASNTNGKLGIIDENENSKLEFEYSSIQKIENTNMVQAINSTTKIIEIYSKTINEITELKNAKIENNKNYIRLYNEEETKYITKEGQEVKNTQLFTNNNIFAKISNGKWGFVEKSGNKVIDFKYEKVTDINEYGFAGIKLDGKWGVVDNDGKIIVTPQYKLDDNEPKFIGEYYEVIYGNGEIYYTK